MRTAVKNMSELGDDWRAETYCLPDPREVERAFMAGCKSGAMGTVKPRSHWQQHGRVEVRDAYEKGRARGLAAHAEFRKSYP